MFLKLSVPSKTFLIGEYFITQNGAALLINTTPNFELILRKSSNNKYSGIVPISPAGKYLRDNAETFANFQLEFIDPHQRQGGLGASSAQFLMLYAVQHYLTKKSLLPQQLLESYWQYCWQGKGIKPSGADIISQLTGEITYFNASSQKTDRLSWPFADLNFYLLRTQNKLKTHQHLCSNPKFKTEKFSQIMHDATIAFTKADNELFIQCINNYQTALTEEDLVAEKTQELLNTISNNDFILAAKGCGALGADVILVLIKPQHEKLLTQLAQTLNLPVIASNLQLNPGLRIDLD